MKRSAGILLVLLLALSSLSMSSEGSGSDKIPGEMVLISGGEFWMGLHEDLINKTYELDTSKKVKVIIEGTLRAEMPRHKVHVDPFYIDKYEVTNGEFARFVKASGYKPEGTWERLYRQGGEKHPAVGVTWDDADAYARWAKKRLPTEAEWEFAARGGADDLLFPWGDEISQGKANYQLKESNNLSALKTSEIGIYQPNSFGLYDIIGNAAEWCSDWYEENYYSKSPDKNPPGPESGKEKIVRGGGWMTSPFFCRISCRGSLKANLSNQQIGFRCARSLR